MNTKRTGAGFTLFELMSALAIASILTAISIPNLRTFLQNNRLTSAANDMMSSVQRARTEAVKRQTNVVVCESPDPTAANPVCGAGLGWIIFQDTNGNWTSDGVATEPVLERHPVVDTSTLIRNDGNPVPVVAFTATGFVGAPGPLTPSRNLVFCDSRGTHFARVVLISPTGRARASSLPADVTSAMALVAGTCP